MVRGPRPTVPGWTDAEVETSNTAAATIASAKPREATPANLSTPPDVGRTARQQHRTLGAPPVITATLVVTIPTASSAGTAVLGRPSSRSSNATLAAAITAAIMHPETTAPRPTRVIGVGAIPVIRLGAARQIDDGLVHSRSVTTPAESA